MRPKFGFLILLRSRLLLGAILPPQPNPFKAAIGYIESHAIQLERR